MNIRKINASKMLLILSVLLLFMSVINFQDDMKHIIDPTNTVYDKNFTKSLQNLSSLIPDKEGVVTSDNSPYIAFTGHYATAPWGATSAESLVNYMINYNYTYLVVFEGSSQIDELKTLFSHEGLHDLDKNFEEIANYTTDFSKFHLYKLNMV